MGPGMILYILFTVYVEAVDIFAFFHRHSLRSYPTEYFSVRLSHSTVY